MSSANESYRAVAAFLENFEGEHDLEAIINGVADHEATKITKSQATRALGRLVKEGTAVMDGEGGERRWRTVADDEANTDPAAEGHDEAGSPQPEEAVPDQSDDAVGADEDRKPDPASDAPDSEAAPDAAEEEGAASESEQPDPEPDDGGSALDDAEAQGAETDDEAEDEEDEEGVPDKATLVVEPLPDPDPQILHIARTVVDIHGAFTIEALCQRAYLPTKRRLVLNVLRAMAEHGLVECSHPFDPDSREAVWVVVYDGVLMDAAIRVQLADAPDRMTCPTCGQTKTFGGAPRPRSAGTGVRNDGKTYLAAGELTGYVIDWVTDTQNIGEEFTVRMITKELVAAYPGKVSDNSDGAIKNALDKMLRPDHRRPRYNDRALVALVKERGPRTYRALSV